MAKKKEEYGNESIKSLKGADRVRKRPAVIFGSDGVERLCHIPFLRSYPTPSTKRVDGHGTQNQRYPLPGSLCGSMRLWPRYPVDYNKAEERWNWDLVFCELFTREANMARVAATMTSPLA